MFLPSFLIAVFFTSLLLLPSLTNADCECGYTVNKTLYTDLIETDFLHLANITADTDWQPQNYTVTSEAARGPYGKNALLSNVVANPLKSKYDWAGEGINGGDAGLQILVRGGIPANGLIPMGELAMMRKDLMYGTFRVGMKITGISGTCGAFFWFFNDTQEIDMEFLSQQFNASSHPVNLVLQSPASELAGFNAAETGTFQLHQLPYDPSDGFHEYRFDWSPDSVSFFADGTLLKIMDKAIPSSSGHIVLSHWSTGNPEWSAGPPTEDAILTVEYMKGYFNSSDPERQNDWSLRCKDPAAVNAICAIPEITDAPNGNMSAKTFFFSQEKNSTFNQTVFGSKQENEGIKLGSDIWKTGFGTTMLALLVVRILIWVL